MTPSPSAASPVNYPYTADTLFGAYVRLCTRSKSTAKPKAKPDAAPHQLAPDIIEAILRGDEPEGISLEKLRKDLPVRQGEQRRKVVYPIETLLQSLSVAAF